VLRQSKPRHVRPFKQHNPLALPAVYLQRFFRYRRVSCFRSALVRCATLAYSYSSSTAQQYLAELGQKTRSYIKNLLELEELPSTLNEHYLLDYKRKMQAKYDELYLRSQDHSGFSGSDSSDVALHKIFQELRNQPGFENIAIADLTNIQSTSNDANNGIEIMAEVRAYFQGKSMVTLVGYSHRADLAPTSCLQEVYGQYNASDRPNAGS
jgi:hypothetical protein